MLIKTFTDNDIGLDAEESYDAYELRKSARAILLNEEGQIALLKVKAGKYHKLPGGGIEFAESIESALEREVMEEVGAVISIGQKIGIITEYRSQFKQIQESHFYQCKTVGEIGAPTYTEREALDGFSLIWVHYEEALRIMRTDKPENYIGKFINKRDLFALIWGDPLKCST